MRHPGTHHPIQQVRCYGNAIYVAFCTTGMLIDISWWEGYVEDVAGGDFTESGFFILQPLEPELGNASGGKRRNSGISSQMLGLWPFGAAFSLW